MSKEARNDDLQLTPAERAKFEELVAMLAKRGFGDDDRLTSFLEHRPGNPFHPNAQVPSLALAA